MGSSEPSTHGEPGNYLGFRRIHGVVCSWLGQELKDHPIWSDFLTQHSHHLPTIPKCSASASDTHRSGSLSLLMLLAPSLQPPGRCMTHGTTTGHLSSMGITMTTSTAAGLPWVGWLSCSGTWGQVRGRTLGRTISWPKRLAPSWCRDCAQQPLPGGRSLARSCLWGPCIP